MQNMDISEELALKIADTVWNKVGTKDVRDMLQIGKILQRVDDVDLCSCNTSEIQKEE